MGNQLPPTLQLGRCPGEKWGFSNILFQNWELLSMVVIQLSLPPPCPTQDLKRDSRKSCSIGYFTEPQIAIHTHKNGHFRRFLQYLGFNLMNSLCKILCLLRASQYPLNIKNKLLLHRKCSLNKTLEDCSLRERKMISLILLRDLSGCCVEKYRRCKSGN